MISEKKGGGGEIDHSHRVYQKASFHVVQLVCHERQQNLPKRFRSLASAFSPFFRLSGLTLLFSFTTRAKCNN